MSKKQKVSTSGEIEVAVYNDLRFRKTVPGANYDSHWKSTMTATMLYQIIASWESAVLFAAREGWVPSTAPVCSRDRCQNKNCTSYLYKRASSTYVWRFRCCKTMHTILKDTMFYNSHYGPQKILELLWMISMRTPITTISYTVFGRQTSEIHA